ncbi:MAG: hypothetical protein AAB430_00975 [Patescibacteria group bacterium]
MKQSWQKIAAILSIGLWIAAGLYGLIFNISYIDEAKYIMKGWLMLNGEVEYYTTGGFLYQHMPGSLLWQGLGQRLWGPSLLAGRLQSFILGLLVLLSSWRLSQKISGKIAGTMTLILLGLAPTVTFYYSTATPQSLLVLGLMLGFIALYESKFLLASVWFSLTFIIRENFLFTLLLYIGFLIIVKRKNLNSLLLNLLVIGVTLSIFLIPGYPGTINILKNLPWVNFILPVSQSEKDILGMYWKEDLQSLGLYWRAIRDFGVVFHAWIIIGGLLIIDWVRQRKQIILSFKPKQLFWLFLIGITGFNFIIHSWAAFRLSPRAIISYFPYVAPLVAVIMAHGLASWFKKVKNKKIFLAGYLALLVLLPITVRYGANFAIPTKWSDLRLINRSGKILKPIVADKTKIIWIAEPISLFMAGKVSYYPLINHTGFYKPSADTDTVRSLGFWNMAMLKEWFNEADLVVIEDNKMKLLRESSQATELAELIKDTLAAKYKLIWKTNDLWPKGLEFYQPLGRHER